MAQVLGSVNMNDYESLQYFQRVLRQSGIIDALEDAGVREGDTVTLCGYSFDYMP
jgi:GTP-binding protein